jgi:uncharacterized protein (DUF4213/DUF364 family)
MIYTGLYEEIMTYTPPMTSNFGKLNSRDFIKIAVSAAFIGALLPIAAAIQTPGFDLLTANWGAILTLAVNGAIIGFVGELVRRLGTNDEGKFLGAI